MVARHDCLQQARRGSVVPFLANEANGILRGPFANRQSSTSDNADPCGRHGGFQGAI